MATSDLVKQLILSFNSKDPEAFLNAAREYIEREKRMKHTQVARELEKALFEKSSLTSSFTERRFKNAVPVPRDSEKGFPLLEIRHCDECWENLILAPDAHAQLEQVVREFKDADILATYNLRYKQKILLCGKPGTGKTYTARVISALLQIPLVYVRFDAIISSYLGETASNLRKVFDFIEQGTWIVLFDEFDIIGKNRDDSHEHGEIKRVVNNFLQMLDNFNGASIIFAATNHQYMLDPAIWRRFDEVVYYQLPDAPTRATLFEQFLRPMPRAETIVISRIVEMTEGLSPSDIKMIAEEAMKLSIIGVRNIVEMADLIQAANKFIAREKVKQTTME